MVFSLKPTAKTIPSGSNATCASPFVQRTPWRPKSRNGLPVAIVGYLTLVAPQVPQACCAIFGGGHKLVVKRGHGERDYSELGGKLLIALKGVGWAQHTYLCALESIVGIYCHVEKGSVTSLLLGNQQCTFSTYNIISIRTVPSVLWCCNDSIRVMCKSNQVNTIFLTVNCLLQSNIAFNITLK